MDYRISLKIFCEILVSQIAMTIRWSTLKSKVTLEPAAPSIKRRGLISPAPLASLISKVYEQAISILSFITGKQRKNLRGTVAKEGSEACSESEVISEEQFSGENSLSADKPGILEKFWKLGMEKVGGVANTVSEFFFPRRASERKSSEVSRNHHADINCADLNAQSNSNQLSNNFAVSSDLACTERFWCDFLDYTPSPFIDTGSQISKRPVKETPSTTFFLFLRHIKGLLSLTSPLDTAINCSVEGESSLQPKSVRSEDGKDEGRFQTPRKRQRKEAISSNYAATYCSIFECVDHDVQERSQMVDSIVEAQDSGTTEMAQTNLPEETSGYNGRDAAGGSGSGNRSGNGGKGGGTGENDGDRDFQGAVDGGGGGGGHHAEVSLQEVLIYANGVLVAVINVTEHHNLAWLRWAVHHILSGVSMGRFLYYGYTLFYKRAVNTPQGLVHKQLFPVGSLLGDPLWSTDPWEKLAAELTEIRAVGRVKLLHRKRHGVHIPRPFARLPEDKCLPFGMVDSLAEKIPGKVAITVNGSVMNYYDFRHVPSLPALISEVYDILRGHQYAYYLYTYGCEFTYLSKPFHLELFPSSVWSHWNGFMRSLSEIRVLGNCDIFWRLERELGRLSLAATSGFLHDYITRNGSLRGYFTRGRRSGRRRGHLLRNRNSKIVKKLLRRAFFAA